MSDSQRVRAEVGASNVVATLARHDDLFTSWVELGEKFVFSGQLTPREREVVVLRVARRTECAYKWASHPLAAVAAGLSSVEIRAVMAIPRRGRRLRPRCCTR